MQLPAKQTRVSAQGSHTGVCHWHWWSVGVRRTEGRTVTCGFGFGYHIVLPMVIDTRIKIC